MNTLPAFNNPGLAEPRETPAAVLTCGLKQKGGGMQPGSTDRFWLGLATGADKKTPRQAHPAFAAFNAVPKMRGSVPAQAFMRCLLVHADLDQARTIHRVAYRGPPTDKRVDNPPHQGPWCSGDGSIASRWDGTEYTGIECPNLRCPFTQGDAPPCKAQLAVLFYPRWEETSFAGAGMPQLSLKYVSRGRRMLGSFEGMIEAARQVARDALRLEIKSWFGFPFTMTLAKRTAPGKRYTDVSFTADGDLVAWLRNQQERAKEIGGQAPVGLLDPAIRTEEWAGIDEDVTSPDPVGPASIKPATVATEEPVQAGLFEEAP